jgi:hypothetical protein
MQVTTPTPSISGHDVHIDSVQEGRYTIEI